MSDPRTLLILIPALPLAAALLTALLGPRFLRGHSHWPTIVALAVSFLCSLSLLFHVRDAAAERTPHAHAENVATDESAAAAAPAPVGYEEVYTLWTWANVPAALPHGGAAAASQDAPADFRIEIALRADPLTCTMLAMVTFIATLVATFAAGYMHGDRGYWRFFSYVPLFVFSMTMLVSVSNFLLLYVFWEAVGVCSYLLIGFWYEKPEAAAAGKKAFLVNRVGDFGFALGVFLIWVAYGTLNFHDTTAAGGALVPGVLGQTLLANPHLYVGGLAGLCIALGLFVGACGKSAQFPLHVWLPDAMEGPTPVSALIHAATMVTAGVYLVARCAPLFNVAPGDAYAGVAWQVVASIGCFTALLAGLIALTQTDLKRVLAYSTVSQLGFMFLALGTGLGAGVIAGMFHLFTHAFFKALLFLASGSVMHAMGGVIDMQRFSGLRKLMPVTCATFWCGALALAGVVPFAGFWSKDAILAAVQHQAQAVGGPYPLLFWLATGTALLTAFYTFRALFLTFYGPQRIPHEAGHHAHESPRSMTVPLIVLAFCAVVVGLYFEVGHKFAHFLAGTPSLAYRPPGLADAFAHSGPQGIQLPVAGLSTVVALLGVGLAAYLYLGDRSAVERIAAFARSSWGLHGYQISQHKFFWDEIYQALFVWPLRLLASLCYVVDRYLVDGTVNACGRAPVVLGSLLRSLQTGLVQFYALAMVLGLLVLLGTLLYWPGG